MRDQAGTASSRSAGDGGACDTRTARLGGNAGDNRSRGGSDGGGCPADAGGGADAGPGGRGCDGDRNGDGWQCLCHLDRGSRRFAQDVTGCCRFRDGVDKSLGHGGGGKKPSGGPAGADGRRGQGDLTEDGAGKRSARVLFWLN